MEKKHLNHKDGWPADDYEVGSYIQATIADRYLQPLQMNPDSKCLDIGCGNGAYSLRVIQKIPQGTLLGIDSSEKMLKLAMKKREENPSLSFEALDVLDMNFTEDFDQIVSFWCLQWCPDLLKAYTNIHRALKKNGMLFTLCPSGDDPIMNSFKAVKASNAFPCLQHFLLPMDYNHVNQLSEIIAKIPFEDVSVMREKQSILLPSLDVFRRCVYGLPFFHGQVPDTEIPALNDALVNAFDLHCQQAYHGEYWFNLSVYVVRGRK